MMYMAAAECGHDGALYNLAAFYELGLGGVFALIPALLLPLARRLSVVLKR